VDANCQSVVNPLADISKYLCDSTANYSNCTNPKLREYFEAMNKEPEFAEQRVLMRKFENEVYGQAHVGNGLWWYKINPHRAYVKGWKIAPSHYLNQQLDNVWIDKS
jgi:peptide/nickel transport system substrate-binding protein